MRSDGGWWLPRRNVVWSRSEMPGYKPALHGLDGEASLNSLGRAANDANFRLLDVKERLVEVGDDVFYIFDAYGEADEAFGDADAFLGFFGHAGVGHQGGEGD